VRSSNGTVFLVTYNQGIDADLLKPGARVALNQDTLSIIDVLNDAWDPLVMGAEMIQKPEITFSDLGGLEEQISLIKESIPRKRITMWAHVIHLGLVLLIIGHVMSTTIVDRGTYDHSVTMIKGEKISWENYEFKFVEVVSESENLEVGDGYLGAIIEVYKDGEQIGTVEPGILRFDKNVGESTSRSEVDRISMASGDLVFIMDGTQAKTLMQGSDLVRITVYDLPGIHLVWIGWILIMIGNIATWISIPSSFLREEE